SQASLLRRAWPVSGQCARACELQFLRGLRQGTVDGCQDDSPFGDVGCHDVRKQALTWSVKRGARLVEQPQGTLHRKQAGEREPPPLPRREVARRQVRKGAEAYAPERGRDLSATSEKIAPEDEVLLDRERWFEGILVADIVGLFSYGELRDA